MKTWNLSSFDDLNAPVLSSIDKTLSVHIPNRQRSRTARRSTIAASIGTTVLVAAIAATSLYLNVSGSDHSLRIKVDSAICNVIDERPPLHLLFGGKHALTWDAEKEKEILELALAATRTSSDSENQTNAIYSALWEDPPESREGLPDLSTLGIKLG